MNFQAFEHRAAELWQEIPDDFRSGVDGLRVERAARAHPSVPDVYTLGECLTENYPSDFGGPDTTRSLVVLYYGSFWRLSRLDPEFDWEGELWETITHELRHHLESLAADDALEDIDYAADQNFRRLEGQDFDPFFYRAGEPLGEGWYRVEDDYFREYRDRAPVLEFAWQRERFRVHVPESGADVVFLSVEPAEPALPPGLCLVQARPRSGLGVLRSIFSPQAETVTEYAVPAERILDE